MKKYASLEEAKMDSEFWPVAKKWLDRGDGVAVYENQDLWHPCLGHRKFVSYGSNEAQLETYDPPARLPDIGSQINWRYYLAGVIPPRKQEGGEQVES